MTSAGGSTHGRLTDGESAMYEVVVLGERELADVDARVIADLYRETSEPTHVHLLLPAEEGEGRVEAALSTLSGSRSAHEPAAEVRSPSVHSDDDRALLARESAAALTRSLERLRDHGVDADGEVVPHEPLDALQSVVAARGSDEVVIMTRTHIVAETLHRDWTSQARRQLGVPVLHLLEQAEG